MSKLINLSTFPISDATPLRRYLSLSLPSYNNSSKPDQSPTHTSKIDNNINNITDSSDAEDTDTGYMKRRLEQLKEDAYSPYSSLDYEDNIGSPDKQELDRLIERINKEGNEIIFEKNYQREIQMAKMPDYLKSNKHARDIATGSIWTGTESQYDASLRMLNDVHKPLKNKNKRKSLATMGTKLFTPKPSLKERVHNAKENALDYQISKISQKKEKSVEHDDDGFAELYRERLLGPAQLLNDSFASVDNSIKSLADKKIMESQRRGDFKNLSLRGKPLPKGYSSDGTLVDRTTYHLNNILRSQDAIPPWIEKQGSVASEVKFFRDQLDSDWKRKAVILIDEQAKGKSIEEKLQVAKMYAENELSDKSPRLRSQEWINHESSYLKTKINSLNDSLRGYNLQAPLASQKLYLIAEKELENSYKRVANDLVSALERHLLGTNNDKDNISSKSQKSATHTAGSGGLLKYGELHQRNPDEIYQAPSESLGSMFLNLFRGDRSDKK